MIKWNKRIASVVLTISMAISLAGCGAGASNPQEEQNDQTSRELQQNDYRGGVIRTLTLKDSVLNVMEHMKSNNTTIRETSPNSYWTADGYQDFVSTFLDTPIITDTQWFNEEETDWDTVISKMASEVSSFSDGGETGLSVTVERNEKDDYSVKGSVVNDTSLSGANELTADYRILYDCDKDWCKAYATAKVDDELPDITTQLFEYQRVDDDTFAIQTSRERLVIVLKPVEDESNAEESKADVATKTENEESKATDDKQFVDMRNREVKEFYYSKLVKDGVRSTFTPYEELPEVDGTSATELNENIQHNELMQKYPFMNEYGDIAFYYGEKDSMFFHAPADMNEKWVFEDKALQQAIVYKDGVLVATTYNKLSDSYERFIYARSDADSSITKNLEDMVVINSLVGVVEEAKVSQSPEDTADTGEDSETDATSEESSKETSEQESLPDTESNTEENN